MLYNARVGTWLLCYLVFSRAPNVADYNELLVCTVRTPTQGGAANDNMAAGRKRGISALLADVTNTTHPEFKRRCSSSLALYKINEVQESLPKGRYEYHVSEDTCMTLSQLIKNKPHIFEQGTECISQYIQRNTTFEMQKAITINSLPTVCAI